MGWSDRIGIAQENLGNRRRYSRHILGRVIVFLISPNLLSSTGQSSGLGARLAFCEHAFLVSLVCS